MAHAFTDQGLQEGVYRVDVCASLRAYGRYARDILRDKPQCLSMPEPFNSSQRALTQLDVTSVEPRDGQCFGIRDAGGKPYEVYRVDDGQIENFIYIPGCRGQLPDGEDWAARVRQLVSSKCSSPVTSVMLLGPGEYHPQVARPWFSSEVSWSESPGRSPSRHADEQIVRQEVRDLQSLLGKIVHAQHFVSLTPNNLSTQGQGLSDILLNACMLFERQCKSALYVNNWPRSNNLSSWQFRKLSKPMRLSEYAVSFTGYPEIAGFWPFRYWDEAGETGPSAQIPWFNAYNDLKHGNVGNASLGQALEATVACFVLWTARWGDGAINDHPELTTSFKFDALPLFPMSEWYYGEWRTAVPIQA